jgi:hypothetical protein
MHKHKYFSVSQKKIINENKKETRVGWCDIQLEKDFQKVFQKAQLIGSAY